MSQLLAHCVESARPAFPAPLSEVQPCACAAAKAIQLGHRLHDTALILAYVKPMAIIFVGWLRLGCTANAVRHRKDRRRIELRSPGRLQAFPPASRGVLLQPEGGAGRARARGITSLKCLLEATTTTGRHVSCLG